MLCNQKSLTGQWQRHKQNTVCQSCVHTSMNRVNEQLGLHGTFGQDLLRIHTDLQAEKPANVIPQPAMKMNDRMHFAHTLIFFLYLLSSSDKPTFLSSLIGKAWSLWLIARRSWEYCSAFLKFSENILKRLSAFCPPWIQRASSWSSSPLSSFF